MRTDPELGAGRSPQEAQPHAHGPTPTSARPHPHVCLAPQHQPHLFVTVLCGLRLGAGGGFLQTRALGLSLGGCAGGRLGVLAHTGLGTQPLVLQRGERGSVHGDQGGLHRWGPAVAARGGATPPPNSTAVCHGPSQTFPRTTEGRGPMGSQEMCSRLRKGRGLTGAGHCKQAADSSLAGQGNLPYKPSCLPRDPKASLPSPCGSKPPRDQDGAGAPRSRRRSRPCPRRLREHPRPSLSIPWATKNAAASGCPCTSICHMLPSHSPCATRPHPVGAGRSAPGSTPSHLGPQSPTPRTTRRPGLPQGTSLQGRRPPCAERVPTGTSSRGEGVLDSGRRQWASPRRSSTPLFMTFSSLG